MPFEEPKDGPGQGMLDWGSFILKMPINPPTAAVSPRSLPGGWQVVEAVNNVSSCGPRETAWACILLSIESRPKRLAQHFG